MGLLYLSYQVILRGGGGGFTVPIISSDPEGRRGGFALPIISSDPEGEGQVHRQGGCDGCECTPPPHGPKRSAWKEPKTKEKNAKDESFSLICQ